MPAQGRHVQVEALALAAQPQDAGGPARPLVVRQEPVAPGQPLLLPAPHVVAQADLEGLRIEPLHVVVADARLQSDGLEHQVARRQALDEKLVFQLGRADAGVEDGHGPRQQQRQDGEHRAGAETHQLGQRQRTRGRHHRRHEGDDHRDDQHPSLEREDFGDLAVAQAEQEEVDARRQQAQQDGQKRRIASQRRAGGHHASAGQRRRQHAARAPGPLPAAQTPSPAAGGT